MKKILLTSLLLSNIVCADTVFGVYAGVKSWLYNSSGKFSAINDNYNAYADIDENFENSNSIFIALEHGVPFLPNVKLHHTNFETNYRFPDDIFCPTVSPNVCLPDTNIDLSHTDITLYYELLDNWVNLDLGVSAIFFNGKLDFDTGLDADINYSEVVPALYGKAMFELPITDLSVSITANIGTLTDESIIDYELATHYKVGAGFSVEAGLRQQTIDLEGFNGVDVHSDATGVFAGLNFHF